MVPLTMWDVRPSLTDSAIEFALSMARFFEKLLKFRETFMTVAIVRVLKIANIMKNTFLFVDVTFKIYPIFLKV